MNTYYMCSSVGMLDIIYRPEFLTQKIFEQSNYSKKKRDL